MADEQSQIAQEQLPIYNKATEAALGTSDDKQSGTEGRATSTAIESPQPPATNPGAKDPTAGISEGAGGLSSTAHIESPVPNNDQSLLSTVKNMFGFGASEEVKAEDKGPAEDATTAPATSILAGSVAAGSVVAATAESTTSGPDTSPAPTTKTAESTSGTGTEAGKGTYLDYQNATTDESVAFPSSQTLPIRSTPGGSLASENTSTAQTDTMSKPTESTERNVSKTDDDSEATGSDSKERDEPQEPKQPVAADGKPSSGKGIENRDAIPTAGGKRLGEEQWGQSDFVPDDPKAAAAKKGVSSSEGQPTDEVKDNTAKNTGGATGGPQKSQGESGDGKEKFVDKIKDKLHIGKK